MNKTIVQTVKIPCRKYYFDHNDKFENNYYLWTKPLWGEGMPFSISKLCICMNILSKDTETSELQKRTEIVTIVASQ